MLASPDRSVAAAYVFTNIADDSSAFFPGFGTPSVNASGTVAFYGVRAADVGIFKGSGGAVTPVVTDAGVGGFADFGSRPAINAAGVVAFEAELDNGNSGIYKGSGGAATLIASDAGPFNAFGAPAINASGTVAFYSAFDDPAVPTEQISAGTGGAVTAIDADNGPRGSYGTSLIKTASINISGTVAFRASIDAGGSGIFTGNGGTVLAIAQTSGAGFSSFDNPSINDSGIAAFRAESSSGTTNGIFKGSGGATTPVAVSGANVFSNFNDLVSINTQGSVAFGAFLFAGPRALYVDVNGAREEVIRTGDTLFGSTITSFDLGGTALNDTGQLTFFYSLASGRTGIALASVPEPGIGAVLFASAGFLLSRRRRG